MAGDKTYITDDQGKLHRATRVHAVTPTDIVWSSNPNDYTVQVKIDGKWHRAVLTMDAGSSTFFDNINIDKALVTGADGKQHTALIVKPESTVTLSDIKTDTHGTIAGTTTGETAVSTYSENWSNVKWQDNVNVYKVLVTGSDGKVHTALLTTSAGGGGGVQVIVLGTSPLSLPDAIANSLSYVKAFGGTEQSGTPAPDAPVDIVSNNGVLKFSLNELNPSEIVIGYYRASSTGALTGSPCNFITGYMPVKPGQSYVFFGRRQEDNRLSSYNRIHWFDANKEYVSTNTYTKDNVGTGVAPSNAYFAQCSCNESGATSIVTTQEIVDGYDWVFQQGTEEVPYIPYVEGGIYTDGTVETIEDTIGNTATAEMLLKVGDYQDVQSIIDGVVTRNVGVKVLDGTENWFLGSTSERPFYLNSSIDGSYALPNTPFCTHFQGVASTVASLDIPDLAIRCGYAGYAKTLYIKYKSLYSGGVDAFKQYLADQYAAGTPVIVVYPLAEPITESVAGQPLQTADGDNVLEITQASLSDLELEAEYTKVG